MTKRCGFTLLELVVILAVIGILVALAAPAMSGWADTQRLNASARLVGGAFSYARSEAIRTGDIHLVFVATDANGIALTSDVVVLDDGRPGSAGQNCDIDAGERTQAFALERGVSFGVSEASAKVASDSGGGTLGASTFLDADGDPASWLLFRPEGMPLAFSSDCSTGAAGSGGGGIYLTNGSRDAAVLVTPLGATRSHLWNAASGSWTQ